MTKEFLYDFIGQNKFSVLSTVTPDNKPESACVGIAVTPELRLVFDTVTDSRKYRNLILNKGISFVIGWDKGQTIQYEGSAVNFNKNEHQDLLKVYLQAFPDGLERKNDWKNITYFYVDPAWIRFSDFNETPPLIEELSF